jgi:peptide/nickel transport system substrate-binding protein
MHSRARHVVASMLVAVVALALTACGSNKSSGGSGGEQAKPGTGDVVKGKKGGTLTVLSNGDVDYVDPGAAYYQFSFIMVYATQRPLFSYEAGDASKAVPDLADGEAQVSDGGKTITVKIKRGVRFSPPVDREVTSADVKYGLERGLNPHVANGYVGTYLADVIGAADAKGGPIKGIETPDPQTIRFKLDKPNAATIIGALSLPASAPVPKDYAAKYDASDKPNEYGFHQVATGPYMIQNDKSGNTVGYKPGRQIVLVRNPNWDASTDYKPAYLDKIVFDEGNADAISASRRILEGQNLVNGQADFNVPPQILKETSQGGEAPQLVVGPSTGRVRYISLNTTLKPFDNINVRKAIAAVIDRNALRLALGGQLAGDIPTHFLPPVVPGFKEAGGMAGPGFDYLKNPAGDMALAESYMKKAGYASGKYTGSESFLMVSDNSGPTAQAAQIVQNSISKLGFKLKLRPVTHDTMYTKFCNVPSQKVPICPSTGWAKDFPDPASMLEPTFNGKAILPTNNSNWPQLNDPAVNAAMAKADPLTGDARNQAFGEIDKMITAQAPAVPWLWDKATGIESKNVNGVLNKFNAAWDLTYTSIK